MTSLRHTFNLSLFLFVIWLLLSGHYTPLLLVLGAVSTLLVVLVANRVDLVDREIHPVLLKPSALLYWLWLAGQVMKANIDVARRILDPRLPIAPTVIKLRATQRTELGRVSYANSITLVPGTVAIDVEGDAVTVHALTRAAAADLEGGEMDRRVSNMEVTF